MNPKLEYDGAISFDTVWTNRSRDAVYFRANEIAGSRTYLHTFPKFELPYAKARGWSVVVLDALTERLVPNTLDRHLISNLSLLERNRDGSLTLVFAPQLPDGISANNWLPTRFGMTYSLTYRFYVPTEDLFSGEYSPPPMIATSMYRRLTG